VDSAATLVSTSDDSNNDSCDEDSHLDDANLDFLLDVLNNRGVGADFLSALKSSAPVPPVFRMVFRRKPQAHLVWIAHRAVFVALLKHSTKSYPFAIDNSPTNRGDLSSILFVKGVILIIASLIF
jgi:hypothetical protein